MFRGGHFSQPSDVFIQSRSQIVEHSVHGIWILRIHSFLKQCMNAVFKAPALQQW